MMDKKRVRQGRLQFMLIAALFLGPLVIAMVLYYSEIDWRPSGYSNHGDLLLPVENVLDPLAGEATALTLKGSWSLVYVSGDACGVDSTCRERLYAIRQMRLMLGKNMDRMRRVFLHSGQALDQGYLATEQDGLIVLQDAELGDTLLAARPLDSAGDGYFLLDPLGNLVIYFAPEINPRDIVSDIKHLLSLSHIG
jgi:hypothetical protein